MRVTINDRTALKVTDVGLKLHHQMWGWRRLVSEPNFSSSSWVKMSLHTESKLPRLPASAFKGGWGGFLTITKSLRTDVELGCDNVIWYKNKLKPANMCVFKLTNLMLVMLKKWWWFF